MKFYCFLFEDDIFVFCYKVIVVLNKGWELQGEFIYVFDVVCGVMCCGQVVVKEVEGIYMLEIKFGDY